MRKPRSRRSGDFPKAVDLIKVSELEFKYLGFWFNPLSIALHYLGKAEQKRDIKASLIMKFLKDDRAPMW